MRRSSRLVVCAGLALGLVASLAIAAPPVLDKVPANAVAVITTPSLAKLHKNADAFLRAVEAPLPLPAIDELLAQMGVGEKGFDAQKASVAVTFLPPPPPPPGGGAGEVEPDSEQMVMFIVETTGYADFLGNFEAKPGAAGGIDAGSINGSDAFFKDLGGGYVAMAPAKGTLERAEWNDGNAAAMKTALGKAGQSLVDSGDLSMIVFTQKAREFLPQLEEAMDEQMADNPAGMAMEQLKDSPMAQFIMGPLLNDSTAMVTSVRADSNGMTLDMAASFKEGSEIAKSLSGFGGSTDQLLSKLPAQPYMFAMAMDMSSPGARRLIDQTMGQAAADGGAMGKFMSQWFKNSDGGAMVVGMPPGGLMSGLFTSTVGYVKTSNPDAFVENMREGLKQLDGMSEEGMTLETSFTPGGSEINGAKVDTWGVKIKVDEDAPEEMGQMSMVLPMVFGQAGGPGGYMAKSNGGLIQTFGKNQTLMNSALKVGNGGEAFTADKTLVKVGEQLPKNRVMEMYVGVKSILESAIPLMAMGNIAVDVEVPPSLPPVGMGLAGYEGGVHFAIYMPAQTLKTVVAVGQQVQASQMAGEEDGPAQEEPGKKNDAKKGTGQPRF